MEVPGHNSGGHSLDGRSTAQRQEYEYSEFVNLDNIQYGKVADVWRHNADPIDAHMATVKTRLLVQRYPGLGYSYCAGAN